MSQQEGSDVIDNVADDNPTIIWRVMGGNFTSWDFTIEHTEINCISIGKVKTTRILKENKKAKILGEPWLEPGNPDQQARQYANRPQRQQPMNVEAAMILHEPEAT